MEQENNDTKGNTGCAIAIGIFVIANIVYYFMTTSKQETAGIGVFLLAILFFVAAFFGIKAYLRHTEDSNNRIVRIGVPIGIFVVLMAVLGAIVKDFETMVAIGSIGFIIFCIIIGILIYNSYKD